jgi:hypothetical protein
MQDSNEVTMELTEGGCLCKAIRYRICGAPLSSIICHCGTCRRASAAPTVAWLTIDRGQFQFLCGSPRIFQSSRDVVRRFCDVCGTPLTYENAGSPNTIDVTTATLDVPDRHPPTLETWLEHKLAWQQANENLGHYRRDLHEVHDS